MLFFIVEIWQQNVLGPWDTWRKIMSMYLVDDISNRQQNNSICSSPWSPQNSVLMVCAFGAALQIRRNREQLTEHPFFSFPVFCPFAAMLTFVSSSDNDGKGKRWSLGLENKLRIKLGINRGPKLCDSSLCWPASYKMILLRSIKKEGGGFW